MNRFRGNVTSNISICKSTWLKTRSCYPQVTNITIFQFEYNRAGFIKVVEVDLKVLSKGLQSSFAGRHQGRVNWNRKLAGGEKLVLFVPPVEWDRKYHSHFNSRTLKGSVQKPKRLFYGQADRKRGGVPHHPPP